VPSGAEAVHARTNRSNRRGLKGWYCKGAVFTNILISTQKARPIVYLVKIVTPGEIMGKTPHQSSSKAGWQMAVT